MHSESTEESSAPQRMLLHACCGPCSLEPVRILRERGVEPVIHYANPNIAPEAEYSKRLQTIRDWCASEGIGFIEVPYDPEAWEATAGAVGHAKEDDGRRRARCRACYRIRFEEAAAYASENGYDSLGSTLSVSPYQYTDIIEEELERACRNHGIDCAFEDYSPHYAEATRRSRDAGMYRQVYCGCRFSEVEAEEERNERAEERAARKAERAIRREAEEAVLEERRRERAEYDEERARRRAVLKALREERKREEGSAKRADGDAPHGHSDRGMRP